jgi:hypothetical protein
VGINRTIQWGYGVSNCSLEFSTPVDISDVVVSLLKDIFVYPSRFFKNLMGNITNTLLKLEYDHG